MNLALHNQQQCLDQLGTAVASLGSDAFYPALCQAFTCFAEVSDLLFLYFPDQQRPQCLYSNLANEDQYALQVSSYINGPYIFDPYYQASLKGAANGAYRLKDIAPDNFKKTEFFRHYYKATHVNDEVSYITALPNNQHLHFSISHAQPSKLFSAKTLSFFYSLSHIITELLSKHWLLQDASSRPSNNTQPDERNLNQALQQALKQFGSTLLTPREHDVLQLVLHGHSNKAAAERMAISLSTVKLHRKRIYQKLDISSQAELFYLFIDALSSAKASDSGDPLQAYMNVS
ncbi:response regulator transcription factor [Dasania marina]|uniref:response regulator transcription factor n=1 Tax=Dasania marina TaxID=471499 RepID=UPI000381D2A3|nr:helix-turn-helix transcriptional regulator [Dasania marina]